MISLLLKNGAKINELLDGGVTALNEACFCNNTEAIYLLLKHGAFVNIPDESKIILFHSQAKESFIKQMAILHFENHPVDIKNLEYIQKGKNLLEIFNRCVNELKTMKNCYVYNGLTSYDVFKLRHNEKKLISLLKNESFVVGFQSFSNFEKFHFYGDDLSDIFEKGLDTRDTVESYTEKMRESGLSKKFCLPSEIVEIIAYFAS